jgi:hypothetical protein
VATIALGGCAAYRGAAPELGRVKPKIQLYGNDFRRLRRVTGAASLPFLFWIDLPEPLQRAAFGDLPYPLPVLAIALGDPSLRAQAMAALHRQHDLRGKPQILHNLIEEWTLANYLGLFAVLRVNISADVIEFDREPAP